MQRQHNYRYLNGLLTVHVHVRSGVAEGKPEHQAIDESVIDTGRDTFGVEIEAFLPLGLVRVAKDKVAIDKYT